MSFLPNDFKKLARVVKYLWATRDMTLTLGLQNDGVMTWLVDASYAVHNDMKGHTGGTMSLGHGSIYSSSTNQKLVSRSSTEAELISVYDIMPQLVWTGNFMRAQGMDIRKVVLMQDNTSTVLLENTLPLIWLMSPGPTYLLELQLLVIGQCTIFLSHVVPVLDCHPHYPLFLLSLLP